MPYELERYSPDIYVNALKNEDINFKSELDALEFYFLAYKAQRAVDPENYFPKADKKRDEAAAFLISNFPEGYAMAFLEFLQSSGNSESCNALISAASDYKILLPYQFMAAYVLGERTLENQFLDEMDNAGMLSDVLKSFGENAMRAIQNNTLVISQGMQDLIALKYAAKQSNRTIEVTNIFAEKLAAFNRIKTDNISAKTKNFIWISPSISSEFTTQYKQSLYLWGIGFALSDSDKNLAVAIQSTGRSFVGLSHKADSPADRGLIQSYSYFAKAYQAYALESGEDMDISKSGKISLYITNQIK